MTTSRYPDRARALLRLLERQIVILDGAMGTMIQRHRLTEADFRGNRFAGWPVDLVRQQRFVDAHAAGGHRADSPRVTSRPAPIVITTNTFNATAISQADYRLSEACELN